MQNIQNTLSVPVLKFETVLVFFCADNCDGNSVGKIHTLRWRSHEKPRGSDGKSDWQQKPGNGQVEGASCFRMIFSGDENKQKNAKKQRTETIS